MTPRLTPPRRALVVGGGVGGLLAARVLTESFDEVVVLDRDELPGGPVPRAGVPQSGHSHQLLARGWELLEEQFPGVTEELVAAGAGSGDVLRRTRVHVGPRPLATGLSALRTLTVSRPLLEYALRSRVVALPGVTLRDRTAAIDLVVRDGVVTGALVCSLDGDGHPHAVPADLVVDASGRRSRTPEWLGRHGFPAPEEDRLRVDLTYVTRRFARSSGDVATVTAGASTLLHPSTAGGGRAGVLIAQEDAWTASVVGYHGARPPTDLAGFTSYARRLSSPAMAEAVSSLEPMGDGTVLRVPALVRRRYERLDRFPRGLLVTGDALCALDPTLGQGTTVAALVARELRTCLRAGSDDLAGRFFARAARQLEPAWAASLGCAPWARDHPDHGSRSDRWMARWLRTVQQAAVDDPDLAVALLRVGHLVAPPSTLVAPALVLRALRGRVLHRRTAVTAAPAPQPPDHRGPVGTPTRERHLP